MIIMEVELVARNSFSSIQKSMDENYVAPFTHMQDWSWSHLRKKFKHKSLERLYLMYSRKLKNGYMSLFILLQVALNIFHCAVLISWITVEQAIVDLVTCCVLNAILFPIVALTFRSDSNAKKSYLPTYLSCVVVVLLVLSDLVPAIYYSLNSTTDVKIVRPVYPTHTLMVCYIFLPVQSNLHAVILGVTSSLCYISSLLLITYRNDYSPLLKISTDIIYHVCLNSIGLYYRFLNEVVVRRSFLDRRKCVESTLRLNYEKDKEEQLTLSILPPHFTVKIKQNFQDICKFIELKKPKLDEKRSSSLIVKELYIEEHDEVSVLYADVVNFSGLTITLPVRKLVETLNDLFGSFDEASERHNVLRIKFLGDCYYCVSGVPVPNAQHAKSCVDLGLDMINIINSIRKKVQKECGVDVDMRIGVHSGKIFSGILGTCKWQYDVWSRDVTIANKMEQTGEAGKVHITQTTLDLLDSNDYFCKPVLHAEDSILRKYGITQSYLITPIKLEIPQIKICKSVEPTTTLTRRCLQNPRKSDSDINAFSYKRRSHFMDSCLRNYHLLLKQADAEMERVICQMPVSMWEQWSNWGILNPLCLTFNKWKWEVPYWREPDPLFKNYISCAAMVHLIVGLMIMLPAKVNGADSFAFDSLTFGSYAMTLIIILLLVPITWTQFLWEIYAKKSMDESKNSVQQLPDNKVLGFLFKTSSKIVWNELSRIAIYFMVSFLSAATAVFSFMSDCKEGKSSIEIDEIAETSLNSSIVAEVKTIDCVATSWQFTEACSLIIFTTFVFVRLHFLIKLCTGVSIATFYIWNIWNDKAYLFEASESWNPYLGSQLAHTMSIVYLTFSLYLIDRQVEYLSRLDYKWKRQLTKEQNEAFHTRNANKLLLQNILPQHVAEYYSDMDRSEQNALYHEAHENVAVMFATLTDMTIQESGEIIDFNKIICLFDRLLFKPRYHCKIEKIKLAGSTYMAACGLNISRQNDGEKFFFDNEAECDYNVLKVMVQFAAEMMFLLESIKVDLNENYKLRIGISIGEVTGGVVGCKKPLYDIWGHAVNMASRMDTTGVPGKIQVEMETAQMLEREGIKCHLRGETYVKPKGLVTTYFIGLDDKVELEKCEISEEITLL